MNFPFFLRAPIKSDTCGTDSFLAKDQKCVTQYPSDILYEFSFARDPGFPFSPPKMWIAYTQYPLDILYEFSIHSIFDELVRARSRFPFRFLATKDVNRLNTISIGYSIRIFHSFWWMNSFARDPDFPFDVNRLHTIFSANFHFDERTRSHEINHACRDARPNRLHA